MVTITDVAKKAEVSITAVSMVINNKGNISDKTRKKVMRIIEEMDFVPNENARTLKNNKNESIGLILSELGGYFHSELIRGIEETLFSKPEYSLFACSANGHSLEAAINMLTKKRCDGYIVFAPLIEDETIRQLANRKVPVVVLDRLLNDSYLFNVLIDNRKGTTEALNYLFNKGYRKLGIIKGSQSYDSDERFSAVEAFRKKREIEIKEKWIVESNFTKKGGYLLGDYFFGLEEKPEAIFCFNDESAIGLIRRLKELGMKIPEDIKIIGFDDIEISSYMTPPLSTVKRPMYEIGALAVELLFDCFNGENSKETIRLDTQFICRGTT